MIVKQIVKEKQTFYTVTFESGEKIRVSEDVLVKHRLLKGMEITDATYQAIQEEAGVEIGLQLAYNYISYQLRSEKEMDQYLKKNEITLTDRKKIMLRLKELRLIDDQVFAESYIRTQIRLSDKGPFYLSQQLKQKGIHEEIIQSAMHLYTLEDQLEVSLKTAEKALKKYQRKSHQEALNKIKIGLMQKGFSSEIIQQTMANLAIEKDEEMEWQALVKEGQKLIRRHQRLPYSQRKQKIKTQLYQKGFQLDQIQVFIDEELLEDE